jgi:hypothetical protein
MSKSTIKYPLMMVSSTGAETAWMGRLVKYLASLSTVIAMIA